MEKEKRRLGRVELDTVNLGFDTYQVRSGSCGRVNSIFEIFLLFSTLGAGGFGFFLV